MELFDISNARRFVNSPSVARAGPNILPIRQLQLYD
ncbi:hypothetical protein BPC006_II2690 [Burkholderia pseudomallei BPC006]|nr:hypothetical protein BPC006_II2690 [Burkholderia pseudomallei BPC006]VUD62725.1 unnamed protein product [Burkholderia pseudomallei]